MPGREKPGDDWCQVAYGWCHFRPIHSYTSCIPHRKRFGATPMNTIEVDVAIIRAGTVLEPATGQKWL